MCDDLPSEIATLAAKGIQCTQPHEERCGSITKVPLPGGGHIGLYQPRHPIAIARP
jgi:hypothetical protein